MRLLNVETKGLKECFGHSIPPYAILSHCWGEEELTLQDLQTSDPQSKRGFKKIQFLCRQAKLEGFEYAWIDTCCIDKTSSVELSEAINSMYTWYAKATACYVYLEDVTPTQSNDVFDQFEKSRWFTRGWTLQELLAPKDVNFYNSKWEIIGSKKDLSKILSRITQIPEYVLLDRSHLRSIGVAQRMSWAANRQTTRLEDIAYCLLGLFDVNIPLLYGEGEKAFLRLQEEILRVSDDQSIFAWDSTGLSLSSSSNGFLAKSPAAFAYAGSAIPIPSVSPTHSFSMTNKGLCITLPLLIRDDEIIGLLNCRPQGIFSGVAGVRLLHTSNPSVFNRDSHCFVQYFTPADIKGAENHTIYINGYQPLYAPWEIYKTFILRSTRISPTERYVYGRLDCAFYIWENEINANTNIVRTTWDKLTNQCRVAFCMCHKTMVHTWVVMLLVYLDDDGTMTNFTSNVRLLDNDITIREWSCSHFATSSHACVGCWGWTSSNHETPFKVSLVEKVLLNQKVIMVDIKQVEKESGSQPVG